MFLCYNKHINRNLEVDIMSVTLGIYKGKDYNSGEFVNDVPVSFQRVWNKVWNQALKECKIQIFVDCHYFSIKQIPKVLEELDRIYEWVQINGSEDTEYVLWRIHEQLKPFLIQFYKEHKYEDYWFDLG